MRKVYSPKHLNIGKKSYMGDSIWVQGIVGFMVLYVFLMTIAVFG
jgi:hypothetical protein